MIDPRMLKAVIEKRPDGSIIRKTGIMSIVLQGGEVKAGDTIEVIFPDGELVPLVPV